MTERIIRAKVEAGFFKNFRGKTCQDISCRKQGALTVRSNLKNSVKCVYIDDVTNSQKFYLSVGVNVGS